MTPSKMRELVKSAFPTRRWAQKVDDMSDSQVLAIYLRLRLQGKL